ncbi:MAG: hypothetical protein KA319_03425 [Ferruginibacter sp.]|nr:hypothetical protein [Ferruginibacter sp.]
MKNLLSIFFVFFYLQSHAQTPSLQEQAEGVIQTAATEWGAIRAADDPTTVRGAINTIINNNFSEIAGLADNAANLWNSSKNLSNNDCSPEFSVSNDALMTAACTGNTECEEVYTKAVNKMNNARMLLERMKCIYTNTKNFTTSAIAFGDSYSGFHAMSGAAWQAERAKINRSFSTLKQTYDTKYEEFIKLLKDGLLEFDQAESQYAQPGWYQRYGFLYFEMMKARYKRAD